MPLIPNPNVPRPTSLTPARMAELLADIQDVLWRETRPDPDDVRNYLDYWNPHKEWGADELEEIAKLLEELRPAELMVYEVWSEDFRYSREQADTDDVVTPSGERGFLLGLPIEDAVTEDEWPDERWTLTTPTPNPEQS
jgi:hypothetical protein